MAQLLQAFDATQYNPTQGAGSLPIGKHPVIIEASEVKPTNANDGGYLELTLRIIDGPQQGSTGAYRLNLYNNNQKTVEIAHRQFSAICHVVGVFKVTDASQLHNLPFVVEVGPQKNEPSYTEVKKVFDQNGNEPGKAGAGQQQQAPQQQGNFGGGQQQQNQHQGPGAGAFGNQNQQQNQQQDQSQNQNQGGGQWGGQQQQQQQQNQQQHPNNNGGNAQWAGNQNQQQQQPAPQQQQQNNGGNWQQNQGGNNAGGGSAPWGQRN